MKQVGIARPGEALSVLCIGAHSDDIEIGAGATILGWIKKGILLDVHWAVLSAVGGRCEEAYDSARSFLADARSVEIDIAAFHRISLGICHKIVTAVRLRVSLAYRSHRFLSFRQSADSIVQAMRWRRRSF